MKAKEPASEPTTLPYSLRSIYLRNCATWMDKNFDPLLPGQELLAIFRTGEGRVDCRESSLQENNKEIKFRSCTFTTCFEFAYTKAGGNNTSQSDEEIEKALIAKVSAEISVDYIINTPDFPDSENLHRWGNSSVVPHAWPYWREFCHSTLLRMNLPVTMIPLVQFSAGPGPAQHESSENIIPQPKQPARKIKGSARK